MTYKILETVTNYSVNCPIGYQMLKDNKFKFITNPRQRPYYTKEELLNVIEDIDAVIAGIDVFDEDIFKKAKKLKLIARNGLGIENIDLVKAKEYGIMVCNTRCSTNAVAEHALALILNLLRKIPLLSEGIKKGEWERYIGEELYNKTVGLLGFGMIPQSLAEKLSVFNCNIIAYDKFPNYKIAEKYNVKFTTFEEIITSSDIISVHLPGGKETRNLINTKVLTMMKQGSYLVNTARGSIVDEFAVYNALNSGRLSGFATDVFENEPPDKENLLLTMPQVICTPHCAANTKRASMETGITSAKAIVDVFINSKTPNNLCNK